MVFRFWRWTVFNESEIIKPIVVPVTEVLDNVNTILPMIFNTLTFGDTGKKVMSALISIKRRGFKHPISCLRSMSATCSIAGALCYFSGLEGCGPYGKCFFPFAATFAKMADELDRSEGMENVINIDTIPMGKVITMINPNMTIVLDGSASYNLTNMSLTHMSLTNNLTHMSNLTKVLEI